MSFYDVISERLAGLTGASTPVEARDALNEFNVRDIEAVRVSEGGGGGPPATPNLETVLTEGGDAAGQTISGLGVLASSIDLYENADSTGSEFLVQPGMTEVSGAHVITLYNHDGNRIIDYQAETAGLTLRNSGNVRTLQAQPDGYTYLGLNLTAHVLPGGAYVTRQHVAPADGDLNAGDMAIWFDQTNGAGKLMIKAKTANGTVAVGEVALT